MWRCGGWEWRLSLSEWSGAWVARGSLSVTPQPHTACLDQSSAQQRLSAHSLCSLLSCTHWPRCALSPAVRECEYWQSATLPPSAASAECSPLLLLLSLPASAAWSLLASNLQLPASVDALAGYSLYVLCDVLVALQLRSAYAQPLRCTITRLTSGTLRQLTCAVYLRACVCLCGW